jgi:hypothetical protein
MHNWWHTRGTSSLHAAAAAAPRTHWRPPHRVRTGDFQSPKVPGPHHQHSSLSGSYRRTRSSGRQLAVSGDIGFPALGPHSSFLGELPEDQVIRSSTGRFRWHSFPRPRAPLALWLQKRTSPSFPIPTGPSFFWFLSNAQVQSIETTWEFYFFLTCAQNVTRPTNQQHKLTVIFFLTT